MILDIRKTLWVPKPFRQGEMWDDIYQAAQKGPIQIKFISRALNIHIYEKSVQEAMSNINSIFSVPNKLSFERLKEVTAPATLNVIICELKYKGGYQQGNSLYIDPETIGYFPQVVAHELGHGIFGPGHHYYRSYNCIMHANGTQPQLCKLHKKRLECLLK